MGIDAARVTVLVVGISTFLFGAMAMAEDQPVTIRHPIQERSQTTTVEVQRGDHLWRISEHHLDGRLGRPASDSEISPYWRLVIQENRDGLRSGDPDLIYPGEMVTLPPAS